MATTFCHNKRKNVQYNINMIDVTTTEDHSQVLVPGRIICYESRQSYCDMNNCPLKQLR